MIDYFVFSQVLNMADELEAAVSDVDTVPCTEAKRGDPTCLNLNPYTTTPEADLCLGCRCAWYARSTRNKLVDMARAYGMPAFKSEEGD